MSHPEEGLLHEWLDGELSPEESARVEALVASNASWAAAAAEARGLRAASARILQQLDQVPGDVIPIDRTRVSPDRVAVPAGSRRFVVRPWMRIAAGLVLVAGTALVVRPKATLTSAPEAAVESSAFETRERQAASSSPVATPIIAAPAAPASAGAALAAADRAPAPAPAPAAVPPRADTVVADLAKKEEARESVASAQRLSVPPVAMPLEADRQALGERRAARAGVGVAGAVAKGLVAAPASASLVSCWQLNDASRDIIKFGADSTLTVDSAGAISGVVRWRDGNELEFGWRRGDTLRTTRARQVGVFLRGESWLQLPTMEMSSPFVARQVTCPSRTP